MEPKDDVAYGRQRGMPVAAVGMPANLLAGPQAIHHSDVHSVLQCQSPEVVVPISGFRLVLDCQHARRFLSEKTIHDTWSRHFLRMFV